MSDETLSGRELDAAVAERVMGWTVVRVPDQPNWFDAHPAEVFPIFAMWPQGGTALYESQHDIRSLEFRPSESIEAAMQVLARFPIWNVNKTDHPDFADRPYSVCVSVHEHEHSSRVKHFEVQAETLEKGICLAALKAAGDTKG